MTWKNHLEAAEGYLELGLSNDAEAEIEGMSAEDKTRSEVCAMRLRIYLSLEKWDLAKACAETLTREFPKNADTWIVLAEAVRRLEGEAAGIQIYKEACGHFADHAGILYGIACNAAGQGDVTRAKIYLATAIGYDGKLKAKALDDEALRPIWDEIDNIE